MKERHPRVLPDPLETPTLALTEAAPWFGIGKTVAYELARRGEPLTDGVPILKVGGSYRVPTARLLIALGLAPEPTGAGAA